MTYLTPYLQDLSTLGLSTDSLYEEALQKNYLIKKTNGEVYKVKSGNIEFGIIDFTFDDARKWTKDIIINNVILEAGSQAWLHDLGEYLPFDAVTYDLSHPIEYHTRYVEDWAEVAWETLLEMGRPYSNTVAFMMRSGTVRTT